MGLAFFCAPHGRKPAPQIQGHFRRVMWLPRSAMAGHVGSGELDDSVRFGCPAMFDLARTLMDALPRRVMLDPDTPTVLLDHCSTFKCCLPALGVLGITHDPLGAAEGVPEVPHLCRHGTVFDLLRLPHQSGDGLMVLASKALPTLGCAAPNIARLQVYRQPLLWALCVQGQCLGGRQFRNH